MATSYVERREKIRIIFLGFTTGFEGLNFYNSPCGRGIVVSMACLGGKKGTGERSTGRAQKDLASEPLPFSSKCQPAKAPYFGVSLSGSEPDNF